MTMPSENFQNLENEEKNQETREGSKKGGMESLKFALIAPPPQSFLCNILSWTHLLLFSLGLSLLLLVVVSVIGSQRG
ncbi:rCG34379, partial [Rattus norvegicus]